MGRLKGRTQMGANDYRFGPDLDCCSLLYILPTLGNSGCRYLWRRHVYRLPDRFLQNDDTNRLTGWYNRAQ